MTEREELETIIRLINKHGLPLSPILEYSVRERLEEYRASDSSDDYSASSCSASQVSTKHIPLSEYEIMFKSLTVNMLAKKKAPNKAILLLAIMKLIEDDKLIENRIFPERLIAKEFSEQWACFFNVEKIPSVWIPYYRLRTEAFWHFLPNGGNELLEEINRDPDSMTIGKLRSLIKYAYLDEELFSYMRDERARKRLRDVLINTYIKNQ